MCYEPPEMRTQAASARLGLVPQPGRAVGRECHENSNKIKIGAMRQIATMGQCFICWLLARLYFTQLLVNLP